MKNNIIRRKTLEAVEHCGWQGERFLRRLTKDFACKRHYEVFSEETWKYEDCPACPDSNNGYKPCIQQVEGAYKYTQLLLDKITLSEWADPNFDVECNLNLGVRYPVYTALKDAVIEMEEAIKQDPSHWYIAAWLNYYYNEERYPTARAGGLKLSF